MSETVQPEFSLQRIYLKDSSFEAPQTPHIFRSEWQPEISLDLNTRFEKLDSETYEVVLSVTATAKMKEQIAFLVEVKQAGIFTLRNFGDDQIKEIIGIVCPGILFPYVREAVSELVSRGSFPQLLLDPINFEALYRDNLQQSEAAAQQSAGEGVVTH